MYAVTVPVLRHYLGRLRALVQGQADGVLDRKLAAGGFSGSEHFQCAIGFSLRATLPVLGQEVVDLPDGALTGAALSEQAKMADGVLAGIDPATFSARSSVTIRHEAGQHWITQDAVDYVTRFALPNFFFHLSLGYATLRMAGAPVGKADFDGLHRYAAGFEF
nr:DUF1993 family protein [Hasllibacter sp. MH4015]